MRYLETLKEALPRVRDAIADAAHSSGRDPGVVRVVAVTKGHPVEVAQAALDVGLHDLGENRVEELERKVQSVSRSSVVWHMIGHVQRRKAARAVEASDLIHSVDTLRLAQRISKFAGEAGLERVPVLFQINTSGEGAKAGFSWTAALDAVLEAAALPGLDARGLMTMAPYTEDERVLRTTFSRLRELGDDLAARDPTMGRELSMGMTNDLEVAVAEGSTMVRLGTALFGERKGALT